MRLLLVRHGESEGNANRVFQGRTDYGLTPLGRLQAERTAEALRGAGVTALVTSPLRRAAETAAIIGTGLGLEARVDEALLEYDVGALSGLSIGEVRERFPALVEAWRVSGTRPPLPGEEGRELFYSRVSSFIHGIEWRSEGTTVAVAHGGVINAACHVVLGVEFADFFTTLRTFAAANCALTEIRCDPAGRLVLARHNDDCHLEGLAPPG